MFAIFHTFLRIAQDLLGICKIWLYDLEERRHQTYQNHSNSDLKKVFLRYKFDFFGQVNQFIPDFFLIRPGRAKYGWFKSIKLKKSVLY